MKFLADENVRKRLSKHLMELGHDVSFVTAGSTDFDVYEHTIKESRILLTNDTDFLDTISYPLKDTPGRIIFRVFPTTFELQLNRLDALIREYSSQNDFAQRLIELETGTIILREG